MVISVNLEGVVTREVSIVVSSTPIVPSLTCSNQGEKEQQQQQQQQQQQTRTGTDESTEQKNTEESSDPVDEEYERTLNEQTWKDDGIS